MSETKKEPPCKQCGGPLPHVLSDEYPRPLHWSACYLCPACIASAGGEEFLPMTAPITEEQLQEFSRLLGLLSVTEEMDDAIAQQGAVLVAEVRRLRAITTESATLRERVRVLEEALREAKRWMGDPEDPSGSFDAMAERFRRSTGHMAPGKDAPAAMGGDREGRRNAWESWLRQERARVWGVVTAALGGGQ